MNTRLEMITSRNIQCWNGNLLMHRSNMIRKIFVAHWKTSLFNLPLGGGFNFSLIFYMYLGIGYHQSISDKWIFRLALLLKFKNKIYAVYPFENSIINCYTVLRLYWTYTLIYRNRSLLYVFKSKRAKNTLTKSETETHFLFQSIGSHTTLDIFLPILIHVEI